MSQITHYQNNWLDKHKGQYFEILKLHEYFSNHVVLLSNPQYDEKGKLDGGVIEFAHEDEAVVQQYLGNLPAGNYAIEVVPTDFCGFLYDEYGD